MSEPAPLAVYIHWPYCARICPYCDFNVVRDRGDGARQDALASAIASDLKAQASLIGPRRLVSIFFGGGTPSLMPTDWSRELIGLCRSLWPTDGSVEVTLEANPTDAEAERFRAFAQAGVGRLSLGVQALDDRALGFLGRNHDAAGARRAIGAALEVFPRVSLDLIYALPGQSADDWAAELREAGGFGVEHVSPYQLTIEAGTAFDRQVRRGAFMPADPDAAALLYETTQAVLTDQGFTAYEVSNHAWGEAARSVHNLAYWRGLDYVGAGPGAHGRISIGGARTATFAHSGIEAYGAAVAAAGTGFASAEPLSAREAAIERLLMGLRVLEGVREDELAALPLDPAAVETLVRGGFIDRQGGRIAATPAGRAVLDRITAELAA